MPYQQSTGGSQAIVLIDASQTGTIMEHNLRAYAAVHWHARQDDSGSSPSTSDITRNEDMKQITRLLAGIALAGCMPLHDALAAPVTSLSIGEIGLLSGGLGSSAAQLGGGVFSAYYNLGLIGSGSTVSQGSTDGAILMGTVQGPGAFSTGFLWQGQTAYMTTLNGAPSGSISNNTMTLDMSGFTGEWNGISFNAAPDSGTLTTAVSLIGNGVYFYTADWTHLVTASDGVPALYYGFTFGLHLEGIAVTDLAPVPEADTYAMMLAGLGLVGWAAHRRRRPD
jgi:hypothetical protein